MEEANNQLTSCPTYNGFGCEQEFQLAAFAGHGKDDHLCREGWKKQARKAVWDAIDTWLMCLALL